VTNEEYGQRLRDLRGELGLSLREVEERGGPSKDVLSPIERGLHKPRTQTLGRIAQAFGMSVTELRDRLEGAYPKEPSLAEWLQERVGHSYLAGSKAEIAEFMEITDPVERKARLDLLREERAEIVAEQRKLGAQQGREFGVGQLYGVDFEELNRRYLVAFLRCFTTVSGDPRLAQEGEDLARELVAGGAA
jgi:transcriptional regulator with XRE-family HTH domain